MQPENPNFTFKNRAKNLLMAYHSPSLFFQAAYPNECSLKTIFNPQREPR
ncbi:hypothetical protein [Wielerella bovis]|nr:hypothetical protein [Wielerella bovis]MCG7657397.1 hypothetical protein [Wielerella bovis]MCG7659618.1 hypothetical protein [Wielerella bovis]